MALMSSFRKLTGIVLSCREPRFVSAGPREAFGLAETVYLWDREESG